MISNERKNKILTIISQTGYIEVSKLARKLYTSESTIRRNLTELEKMGLVKRSYGKVTLANDTLNVPLKLRSQKKHDEKRIIATKAAEHLEDNSVIFIDGSSTCLHMAPFLSQYKNLTVYTNGVELCTLLADSGVPVYSTGGRFIPRSLAFAGADAIRMAQNVQFDALFFSCAGFCDGILSDYEESESQLRRELIKQAKRRYFLFDTSKIGKSFPYIICREKDVTQMITELDTEKS